MIDAETDICAAPASLILLNNPVPMAPRGDDRGASVLPSW